MTFLRDWDGLRQTNDDISRKFERTYVVGSHPEVPTGVLYLHAFDGATVSVTYPDGVGNKLRRAFVPWVEIDVTQSFPTTVGVFPHGNGILFLKRTAARQWSVGLGHGTAHLWDYQFKNREWGMAEAISAYFPKFENTSVEEAVKRFEEKKVGQVAFALNSTYWLARRDDKIVLYRNRNKMGSFMYGSFFLHGACRDFTQELWDDLRLKVKNV